MRIDDLVEYSPSVIPGLANLAPLIVKNPSYFFPLREIDLIHDVFLSKLPEINNGQVTLSVVAFVKYKTNLNIFEKLTINYPTGPLKIEQVNVKNESAYPLKELNFKASVGLVDRKLILVDQTKDIKMVFPIGVGAFDEGAINEGQISLLTPRFSEAFLDKRAVISKREKPKYFQGKPFIRVLKGTDLDSDSTPIGFHIEINNSFIRGFDSHGCMRLREKDLMVFHDLIVFGNDNPIPLTIQYRVKDLSDNPALKFNKVFKTVLNKGTNQSPFFILDRDNLIQLAHKENSLAPLDLLVDNARDNFHELFNYDTPTQMLEQEIRRKNECDAKVMSGAVKSDQKSYQECLDAGKRKDTFKDRMYRKYMGIDEAIITEQ